MLNEGWKIGLSTSYEITSKSVSITSSKICGKTSLYFGTNYIFIKYFHISEKI